MARKHVDVSHTRNIFKSISAFLLFFLPQSVLTTSAADVAIPDMVSCEQLPSENLSIAMGQKIAFPNRVLADTRSFVQIIVGFPDAVVRIHENTSKHIYWLLIAWTTTSCGQQQAIQEEFTKHLYVVDNAC